MNTVLFQENLAYGDKPVITLLLENTATKEIRIVFRKGQEMKAHKAPYPIVIHVIEGGIDFGCGEERILLEKGALVALEGHVVHDLKATEDAMVRLSLCKADSADRVTQAAAL